MARRRSRVIRSVSAGITLTYLRVMSRLPLSMCRRFGIGIGWLAYLVVPRVRRVALANLEFAYGDTLTAHEKRAIARAAARNMGLVAAEFAHIPRVGREIPIAVKGLDHLATDSGIVALGAHLGNWEWMGAALVSAGRLAAAIVRPLDDPRMNNAVDSIRRQGGMVTIPKGSATGEVIRRIREGAVVGILADQSPRQNGIPVTFFGQRTWATVGPALIALRAGAPIHLVTITRDTNGVYTLAFSPPIDATATGNLTHDLQAITQRCQDAIEAAIRENPDQWLWMHRRFKPRPRLEREWNERLQRSKRQVGE